MAGDNKINDVTLQKRVEIVKDLIIDGHPISKILRIVKSIGVTINLNETPWGVCDRQIKNYIEKATEEFRAEAVIDRSAEIGKFRNRYTKLYQKSFAERDYRTAATIAEKEIKLLGLDPSFGGNEKPVSGLLFGDVPEFVEKELR